MSEFKCFKCMQTFNKINNQEWNDIKAAEELLTKYPECKNDATDILCDNCYKEFEKWFSTLTPKQKEDMRKNHG